MPRLFIAVRAPACDGLVAFHRELSRLGSAVRPVDPRLYHLTLLFLGHIDADLIEEIRRAMINACADATAFDLAWRGLGLFPDPLRPRVLWTAAEPDRPLIPIVASLREALLPIVETPDDRPWQGHLTLARVQTQPPDAWRRLIERYRHAHFGTMRVGQVDLVESTLTPTGPNYDTIATAALDQAPPPPDRQPPVASR